MKNEKKSIHLKGDFESRNVWLDGELLSPVKSQALVNHSPDGFAWGYGGSGPAQLALAICLELIGKHSDYQSFKWDVIAKLPKGNFDEILTVDLNDYRGLNQQL